MSRWQKFKINTAWNLVIAWLAVMAFFGRIALYNEEADMFGYLQELARGMKV